ncbi:diuretic hormone receptor [Drosophila innubila]|uniref:diuretic hormone receptor n=1 Tax=Drosophila innubila TaxID=198719 RepID=UPI00148C20E9|nr:diuretic hormone receptor [Drosophila innubila]
MADAEWQALVESLGDGNAISNFSMEMLQRASELIGSQPAHSGTQLNRTLEEQCKQQADLDEILYPTHTVSDTHSSSIHTASTSTADKVSLHCPTSFDSVLCWPRTNAGSWAILSCFEEFKGVHYDTTENATRFCHANGTWNHYSNYTRCHQQTGSLPVVPDFSASVELPAIIYACGYFISFATLVVALIIFLSFKDLRCLRNTIHANLFLTYITSALLWILTLFLQVITTESSQAGCITLVIMFQYFYLTNFFWMFVEERSILDIECSWMSESHIDWIFKGPASFAILINLVFLIRIMWVLITKLRSVHTLETRQYYKASKALLVLIPLFGITYLLVLTGPEQGISRNLFEAVRAFLLSTQGFFVAFFYCFLNSEVRQTLRHRFIRWQESRSINRSSSLKNRRHRASKDYSQRSRTESLRLTLTSPVPAGHYE